MLLLVALCAFLSLVSSQPSCDLPPKLWCSSPEIAKRCNVEKQCEAYLKGSNAPLVRFTLYMESLCPDCKYFIVTQLYPTYKSIGQIMNLTIVPYGNAHETKVGDKWKFSCQHGQEECYGNLIESCAIHFYPNTSIHFPFIHCIEMQNTNPRESAPECAKKFDMDYGQIKSCADGALGNSLEHEMALKTDALQPPHEYVPWVTLNGVHTKEIQSEAELGLEGLICKMYHGTPKPEACRR